MDLVSLPEELLLQIMYHIPTDVLINLGRKNKAIQKIISPENFWRDRFTTRYPDFAGRLYLNSYEATLSQLEKGRTILVNKEDSIIIRADTNLGELCNLVSQYGGIMILISGESIFFRKDNNEVVFDYRVETLGYLRMGEIVRYPITTPLYTVVIRSTFNLFFSIEEIM